MALKISKAQEALLQTKGMEQNEGKTVRKEDLR